MNALIYKHNRVIDIRTTGCLDRNAHDALYVPNMTRDTHISQCNHLYMTALNFLSKNHQGTLKPASLYLVLLLFDEEENLHLRRMTYLRPL